MVKFEIQIKEKGYNKTLVEAVVTNGNWKYTDSIMDSPKLESVTLNTINKTYYLTLPVKDSVKSYDWNKYHETGELEAIGEYWRYYNTLLEYLNCRMGNIPKCYCGEKIRTFECVIMNLKTRYSNLNKECEVSHENGEEVEVIIKRVG